MQSDLLTIFLCEVFVVVIYHVLLGERMANLAIFLLALPIAVACAVAHLFKIFFLLIIPAGPFQL